MAYHLVSIIGRKGKSRPYTRTKDARTYISEIHAWQKKNFDSHIWDYTGLGPLEEIGEWARSELKFKQRIREGSDSDRKRIHAKATKDSIGDAMIFVLGLAGLHRLQLDFKTMDSFIKRNEDYNTFQALGIFLLAMSNWMMQVVARESEDISPGAAQTWLQLMLNALGLMCVQYGQDPISGVLDPTWNRVKVRNWRRYPRTGKP